jgi:hypothetical protein
MEREYKYMYIKDFHINLSVKDLDVSSVWQVII